MSFEDDHQLNCTLKKVSFKLFFQTSYTIGEITKCCFLQNNYRSTFVVLRLRRIFYPRFYPLHLLSYLNSWECSVLNKGTTGAIFITYLVWRGLWLGIEPGTSRTRSQHSTTRLSRRRYLRVDVVRFYFMISTYGTVFFVVVGFDDI